MTVASRAGRRSVLALLVLVAARGAAAAACSDPCLEAARQSYRECRLAAAAEREVADTLCRGRNPACTQACLVGEQDCVAATGLAPSLEACLVEQDAALQQCRQRYAARSNKLAQCNDQAQLAGFQCRNGVRRTLRPQLAACRRAYKTCVAPCGPPEPPAGSRLCRAEARDAQQAAIGTCNQTAEADKAACAGKDAACVQTCRDARTTCGAPTQMALDAALAACESTRRGAVLTCDATTPVGSARDACIEAADSDAFLCRDAAREAGQPGLITCAESYVPCVAGCPPA